MLYHGSTHFIADKLEPRVSYACKSLVYATDDYFYALVRAGYFDMRKFMIKEDYDGANVPFRLVEIVPGAFKYAFDRPGYIYEVEDEMFISSPDVNEFVSEHMVTISKTILIPNVFEEMMKHPEHYELIYYDEADSYWPTVRGGKDGYLERRRNRIKRIGLV